LPGALPHKLADHENCIITGNSGANDFMNRFFQRLFSWKTFRRVLLVLVGLITLIALLWTEEKLRGKYEWEKYKRELEAKGERFDFASFAPPPISDESNFFMAPVWAGVLNQSWEIDPKTGELKLSKANVTDELRMPIEIERGLKSPSSGGDWRKGKVTDLATWQEYYRKATAVTNVFPVPERPQTSAQDVLLALSRYDSVVEALHQAADNRPVAQVPLDYNDPSSVVTRLFPFFADLKGCTRALQLRAIAELAAGKTTEALSDVKLMMRLTDSIRNQPLLISHLVRIALVSITLEPIYEGLAEHRWNDEQLAEIEAELVKEDFLGDYEFVMRGERAYGMSMLSSLPQYQGLNPFFHQWQVARARMFQEWVLPCVNVQTRLVSPGNVRRLQDAEATEWKLTTPYNIIAKMVFPAINKAVTKFTTIQAGVDVARVACALERYRLAHDEYPETLDVLSPQFIDKLPHDIINGQPLHYHRTDDGRFVLYSVGWNEKDDGGVRGKGGGWSTEEGDWVWEYPAKTYFE
jgi:hypothetical protein